MNRRTMLAVFALYLGLAFFFQWKGNGYSSELSWHSDEPAHYLNGLLVRDWLVDGLRESPIRYAINYYLHYPRVAIGHWPPVFSVMQAIWNLPPGATPHRVMLLMAVLAAAMATLAYRLLRDQVPVWAAVAAGALLLSLQPVRWMSWSIMTEIPLAVFILASVRAWARYLETEQWRDSMRFGLWASVAILTKAMGVVVAFAPVISVLLLRKWGLMRHRSFWLPAFVVVALCLPWYALAPGARHEAAVADLGVVFQPRHLTDPFFIWTQMLQWPVALLVAGGGVVRCLALDRDRARGSPGISGPVASGNALWASALGVLAAYPILSAVIDVVTWEPRQMMTALPLLVMFAAAFWAWLTARRRYWALAPALLLAAWVFQENVRDGSRKDCMGMDEAAAAITGDPALHDVPILVASDANGEGALIAEVASRESRPGHIIVRASKLLGRSEWMGQEYQLLTRTPAELMAQLDFIPVGLLVTDGVPRPRYPHEKVLAAALAEYSGRWQVMDRYPQARACPDRGRPVAVYRLLSAEGEPSVRARPDTLTRLRRLMGFD